jgi:hypothetical protein
MIGIHSGSATYTIFFENGLITDGWSHVPHDRDHDSIDRQLFITAHTIIKSLAQNLLHVRVVMASWSTGLLRTLCDTVEPKAY